MSNSAQGFARLAVPLVALLSKPLRGMGINLHQLSAILTTKLTLDDRRVVAQAISSKGKSSTSAFRLALLANFFVGLVIAGLVGYLSSPLTGMTVHFTVLLTFLALNLVSGYSDTLLDPADQEILAPQPVSHRTALAARLAHIFVYVGLQVLAFALPTFVVGTVRWHLGFVPLYLVALVDAALFVVATVLLFYGVALHLISARDRIRDWIAYAQIILIVAITGGYQLASRALDFSEFKGLELVEIPWLAALPPAWFAGPFALAFGPTSATAGWLTVLALLVPAGCAVVVLRIFADSFFQLSEASGSRASGARNQEVTVPAAAKSHRARLGDRLSRRLCGPGVEQAGFQLSWKMIARDRRTKLRLYPTVGLMLAFGLLPLFGSPSGTAQPEIAQEVVRLFSLYLLGVFGALMASHLQLSEQMNAAWVVRTAPVEIPGRYLLGALKAMVVQLLLPLYLILAVALLSLGGLSVVKDLLLGASGSVLLIALAMLIGRRELPFALEPTMLAQASALTEMLLLMAVASMLGVVHWIVSTFVPWGVEIAIPVVLGLAYLALRIYGRTPWRRIDSGILGGLVSRVFANKITRKGTGLLLCLASVASLGLGCSSVTAHPRGVQTARALPRTVTILVPGVTGTALREIEGGRSVWGSGKNLFFPRDNGYSFALPLATSSGSQPPRLVAGAVLDRVRLLFFRKEIYGKILKTLVTAGWQLGSLEEPKPSDTLFAFRYDWRRDNFLTAALLVQRLEALRRARGVERLSVNLICQSNGGYICRYLAKYGAATRAEAQAGHNGALTHIEIERLILVGTANGGSLRILRELDRGRSYVPLVGRDMRPEVLFTFPSLYQDLPAYRDDLFVNARGDDLAIDLWDATTWADRGWSIFAPKAEKRANQRPDLFGDRAQRLVFLSSALDSAQQLQRLLRQDAPNFSNPRYYLIQNAFDPTPDRAVVTRRRRRAELFFTGDRRVDRDQYLSARSRAPGDGHASLDSQNWLSPQEQAAVVGDPFFVPGGHFEMILEPATLRRLVEILEDR